MHSGVLTPGGLVDDAEAPAVISKFALSIAGKKRSGISLKRLIRRVEESFFATGGLQKRLAGKDIGTFLDGIGDLDISYRDGSQLVRLADKPLFGPPAEQPVPQRPPTSASQIAPDLPVTLEAVRELVAKEIRSAQQNGKPLTKAFVGNLLKERFPGEGTVYRRLGLMKIDDILKGIEGLEIGPLPANYLRFTE